MRRVAAAFLIGERHGLRLFVDVGDVSGVILVLTDFADLALLGGDRERAARLAGAALAHEKKAGAGLGSLVSVLEGRGAASLTMEADLALMAEGQAFTLDQAVAYALERTDAPAATGS